MSFKKEKSYMTNAPGLDPLNPLNSKWSVREIMAIILAFSFWGGVIIYLLVNFLF